MKNNRIIPRLTLAAALVSPSLTVQGSENPNILWLVIDDMGIEMSCYGEKAIQTPNIDRLAKEGLLFSNAFVTASVCSPVRSAMITGMYQTTIGAHEHQSGRGTRKIHLPSEVTPVPVLFQNAGYFTSNSDYPVNLSRIGKTDYNFEWDPAMYTGVDWSTREPGQPFFAQIQLWGGKHRDNPQWYPEEAQNALGSLTNPSDVVLPPYYPRDSVILDDWAQYLDCVRITDKQVGEIIQRLEDEGILDNTLIILMGDGGISHARGKQFLYDEGIRTPFIVRGPGIKKNSVRHDLIEHIDMAAMSLAFAGIEVPFWMQGRDIFSKEYQEREAVFAARDRCGETVDRIRAVRTGRFKYIRNFYPDRPHLQPTNYKDSKEIIIRLRELYDMGKLDLLQEKLLFAPSRKPEELYDIFIDPFETINLADDPWYADTLKKMRLMLEQWSHNTHDPPPESPEIYEVEMRHQVGKTRGEEARQTILRNINLMNWWEKDRPLKMHLDEKTRLPENPELFEPSVNTTEVTSIPFFRWQDVAVYPYPGSYEIQIATDPFFNQLADNDVVPALANYYAPAKEMKPAKYYWRVRYIEANEQPAPWSLIESFSIKAPSASGVVKVHAGATWDDIDKAYQQALDMAAARKTNDPGVELRFETSLYELQQPPETRALFETKPGHGNVIINGQGSTFILEAFGNGTCSFLAVSSPDSERIQVKNCIVDYHPASLTTIAARIIEVDHQSGAFTAELLPEYAAVIDKFGTETQGVFLSKDTYQRRLIVNSVHTEQGWNDSRHNDSGLFHFKVSASAVLEVEPGDYWVSVMYGGGDLFIVNNEATDIVVNNNTFYAARTRIGNIGQRARIIDNGFLRKEGRVWCIPKGGFGTVYTQHTWLENNVIEGTRDDMYHLLHGYGVIRNNRLHGAYRNSIHVHGERVWVEGNTILYAGQGGIHIGGKGVVTMQWRDLETLFTSTEYRGLHCLIIRNNTIIGPREQGIHTRRPDSDVFSPVRFKGIVKPEYEGYQFSDIIIEGNTIVDAGRNQGQGIYMHAKGLQIRNNTIINSRANSFGHRSYAETEIGIHIDRCLDVEVDGNRISDQRISKDRKIVFRQSRNAWLNGEYVHDDPDKLFDYRDLTDYSLVCQYRFDETEGETAFDSKRQQHTPVKGEWMPRQGVSGLSLDNQRYSTIKASWRPEKRSGGALAFNGQTDYLFSDVRDVFNKEVTSLALSMYFNATIFIPSRPEVLYELSTSDSTSGGLRLIRVGRELRAEVWNDTQRTTVAIQFYYDKYWQHVTVVFDQGKLQLFMNGYLLSESPVAFAGIPSPDSLYLGAGIDDAMETGYHFEGMVDDFRLYR